MPPRVPWTQGGWTPPPPASPPPAGQPVGGKVGSPLDQVAATPSPTAFAPRLPMTDVSAAVPQPAVPTLQQPSQREQFFDPADFQTPGFGESFAERTARDQQAQMGPGNVANQFFEDYNAQIGQDPGLGAYYDRAKARTRSDVNRQMSAMGQYGSSFGADYMGSAMTDLDAQRANREADYMMRQQQLGGQLAGQANNAMLGWTQGLAGLGLGADAAGRARMGLGMTGATSADAGLLDRNAQMYDQIFGLTNLGMQGIGGAQQQAMATDQQMFESGIAAEYGLGAEGYNQALQAGQRGQEDVGVVAKVIGSVFGGI